MVRRSRRTNIQILAILFLAIAIVEKRNCEGTAVNRRNGHRYPPCRSSEDFPENCEQSGSPVRPFRTIKDSPLTPSNGNRDVSVTIKPKFTGKFPQVPTKVNDAQGKIPVENSTPFKSLNETPNVEEKKYEDRLHLRRKRSTFDDPTHVHAYIDSRDNVNRLRSLKQVSPVNYGDSNNVDDKNGKNRASGGTLLDLENPVYNINSAVYEDNEENTHIRVKRDKAKYRQCDQEPPYSEQKYIEDLADSFPPVSDNKNDLIAMKKRESSQNSDRSLNFTNIQGDIEQLGETTKFPYSPTFAPLNRKKYFFSNESKPISPTVSSNLMNGTFVDSDRNSITALTKSPINDESGLKIALDAVYPDLSSLSAESVPVEVIRKKRNDYDKEYAEKETIESLPNKQTRSINDFAREQENAKVLEENDREYDDYYAERPKIRSYRETLNDQTFNTGKNGFDADDYVVEDDRSDPGAIENQPDAVLLRRKRYGKSKVYSEAYPPLDARFRLRYNSADDFRQQRNTAKMFQRSDLSNAEKSKDRFNEDQPSRSFSEVDKTVGAKEREDAYEGDDSNAGEELSRLENRPLHNNRRQIRGKFSRYRRRIPTKTMRRAYRRAKKPSRKRKGRKHKRRKGASAKRQRKAADDKQSASHSSRIGSPRVVDEMQVESKIEKRESSDGKTEIEIAKRDANFRFLQPGRIVGLRGKNAAADFAHSSNEENLHKKRRDAVNAVSPNFENTNDDLRKGKENLNDVSGKVQNNEEKAISNEEVQRVREESNNVQERVENTKGDLQSVQDESKKVNEAAESNRQPVSSTDEEKAALDLDIRIKRLINAYRDVPLSSKDVNDADLKKDRETDSMMSSATGDRRDRYSKENEESSEVGDSKARFKRHEIGARKHTSRNNVDMKELKYYENVHEPAETAVQGEPQKENTAPEKFRDDRAVKSIEEIRELAEKLVSKATELQSYVSAASNSPVKRNKKKVNIREAEGCYSNATKIPAPTTGKELKIAERCVGSSSSSKAKIIDLGERERQRFAEEYSTRQLQSEKTKPAEKYRVERAFERAAERRKRKSRKWDRWTDWSSCSVTCGKGRQIRWRHCLRDCNTAETEMEEKVCQLPACPPGKFLGIF